MVIGKKIEYEPFEAPGIYVRGMMHQEVYPLLSFPIYSHIRYGLEATITQGRIQINEIR